jgi:hypothetical protein
MGGASGATAQGRPNLEAAQMVHAKITLAHQCVPACMHVVLAEYFSISVLS